MNANIRNWHVIQLFNSVLAIWKSNFKIQNGYSMMSDEIQKAENPKSKQITTANRCNRDLKKLSSTIKGFLKKSCSQINSSFTLRFLSNCYFKSAMFTVFLLLIIFTIDECCDITIRQLYSVSILFSICWSAFHCHDFC